MSDITAVQALVDGCCENVTVGEEPITLHTLVEMIQYAQENKVDRICIHSESYTSLLVNIQKYLLAVDNLKANVEKAIATFTKIDSAI